MFGRRKARHATPATETPAHSREPSNAAPTLSRGAMEMYLVGGGDPTGPAASLMMNADRFGPWRDDLTLANYRDDRDPTDKPRQDEDHSSWMEGYLAKAAVNWEAMYASLRPATVEDYSAWLAGYIQQGGAPTHRRDYPMGRQRWYVATQNFQVLPLYGACSVNIIVPAHIVVTGTDTGHNSLYFIGGFQSRGFHNQPAIVPVFSDTKIG